MKGHRMSINEIHDESKRSATLKVLKEISGEAGDPRDRYCRIIGVLTNHLERDEELTQAIEKAFKGSAIREKEGT